MDPYKITWIYIVLLVIGGLVGYFKSKSHVSLYTSVGFAVGLMLTVIGVLEARMATVLANILMAALLVVFTIRLAKTRKFMPAGLMVVLTIAALALRNIHF